MIRTIAISFLLLMICCTTQAQSQTDTLQIIHKGEPVSEQMYPSENDIASEEQIFMIVEQMPEFPGGEQELINYLVNNTVYPEEAQKNDIKGKVVVKFVVFRDGSVGRVEITRSVHPLLDAEAQRVVATMPKWKPGMQQGKAVDTWYMIPVVFALQ